MFKGDSYGGHNTKFLVVARYITSRDTEAAVLKRK